MQIQQKGLTGFQVSATVALSSIGLTVLFVPRIAAEHAGIDGALAAFAAGIFSMIITSIIILLSKRFPNQTVIEYSQQILGKYLGKIFGAIMMVYTLTVSSYILRGFADAMKILLLPRTPLEVIMICMLLIVLYCVHGGISTISKTFEIFLLPVLLVIGATLLFNLSDVQLFRFRSSLSEGILPVIQGASGITFSYLGYEILFFLLPFVQDKQKVMLFGIIGMVPSIIIYSGLTFVAIGILDSQPTSELMYPTIHLARRIGFEFIERFDIFFIVFWILAVFTSLTIYLYMAAISLTRLIGLRNYKPFISILLPVCYSIAILPQNISEIGILGLITNYSGLFIILNSIPLLILSIIRKKGGVNNA
jgi:spore germination protein